MRAAVAAGFALLLGLTAPGPASAQGAARAGRPPARLRGNKAIRDAALASAIATTNSSWFARAFLFRWLGLGEKRYFDEQEFRRDVVRLEVLYQRSGYPARGRSTPWSGAPPRTSTSRSVSRKVSPILVTRARASPGLDSLPARVRRPALLDLPLQQGDPFNRFAMQASADYHHPAAPGPRLSRRPPSSPPSRANREPRPRRSPSTSHPGAER